MTVAAGQQAGHSTAASSTVPAFRYGDSLPVGQLRGRNLPIPAAIFAEKLVRARGDARQTEHIRHIRCGGLSVRRCNAIDWTLI
jgi:hypothetical protein